MEGSRNSVDDVAALYQKQLCHSEIKDLLLCTYLFIYSCTTQKAYLETLEMLCLHVPLYLVPL